MRSVVRRTDLAVGKDRGRELVDGRALPDVRPEDDDIAWIESALGALHLARERVQFIAEPGHYHELL